MTSRRSAAIVAACLMSLSAVAGVVRAEAIDATASSIGFTLKTRWGQLLVGRFPRYEGEIATLDDGHHRVAVKLWATDVEIEDSPTYTKITRGKGFFDAERFPLVKFESDAYPPALTRTGGELGGQLSIRGVRRREVFTLQPATCDTPGVGCDVVASGSIDRNDYGVDRWAFALSNRVVFILRVRVAGDSSGA